MPDSQKNLHKKLLGKKGENLTVKYLKDKGCKILHTNYKTPFGEADIIAEDGDEIVFVEVKTRTGDEYGTPGEAVTRQKRQRYYNIAKYFWACTGEEPNARFDVAEVSENKVENYIENAF